MTDLSYCDFCDSTMFAPNKIIMEQGEWRRSYMLCYRCFHDIEVYIDDLQNQIIDNLNKPD